MKNNGYGLLNPSHRHTCLHPSPHRSTSRNRRERMSNQNATLKLEFIEQQRKRLDALRRQLLGGEQEENEQERVFQEAHTDEAHEPEEVAQGMAQNEINQAVYDTNRRRLRNIERALQKIDEGSYGLSDRSGTPIAKARLETTPEAILTLDEERREEGGR
jgi:DnaK suppressor protein